MFSLNICKVPVIGTVMAAYWYLLGTGAGG